MKIAVVIVNWNSGEALQRCLRSLASVHAEEIVVVDNASNDESVTRAAPNHPGVRFIANVENRGFAAGVNQGARQTRAPLVLLLNPDVEADTEAIEELIALMERVPRAGAAGGDVNRRYLPRRLATPWSLVFENLGINRHAVHPSGTEVEQAAAAAMLIRREAFDDIGGFDERFHPAWYEDVDFCKRLRSAGWSVHFVGSARFAHEGGYSARMLGRASFLSAFYRNQLRYVQKHFGSSRAALVRGSIIVGMFGRMVLNPSQARAYVKVIVGAAGAW